MSNRPRLLLIVFALLGLGASVYALNVHYRLLTDPDYIAFCDINETVSCQQVFQSSYGSVGGIPVAAGGAIWASLVLLLAAFGMKQPKSELAGRVAGYIFLLATAGLAAVFYFGYASFFVLGQACPVCITIYVAVAGIFLVSAGAATSLTGAASGLGADLATLKRSQTGITVAAGWLAAAILLVVLFPRGEAFGTSTEPVTSETFTEPALEPLSPEQVIEWEKYLDSRTPVADLAPTGDAKVRVVKFNDYQCPACRQTWSLYRGIIARYEQEYPGVFVYDSLDYPLEPECGLASNHAMACEAAAAVRMAEEKGKGRELEAWLFSNQSFEMTRDDVKRGLQEVAQISDFDERYASYLDDIRADVQLGQKLGVNSTPTFFINGVQLDSLRPSYFDATIRYMLKKAGVA
jgi:uncharacterized membrane protein